jgi:hypothetical protein
MTKKEMVKITINSLLATYEYALALCTADRNTTNIEAGRSARKEILEFVANLVDDSEK